MFIKLIPKTILPLINFCENVVGYHRITNSVIFISLFYSYNFCCICRFYLYS